MSQGRRDVYLLCSRRPIVDEFVLLAQALADTGDLDPVLVFPPGLSALIPSTLPAGCRGLSTGLKTWRAAGMRAFCMYLMFACLRRLVMLLRACRMRLATDFLETWEAIARGRSLARHVLRLGTRTAAVLTADDRDIRSDQGVITDARRNGVFTLAVAFGKSDPTTDAFRRASPEYSVNSAPWRWIKAKIARAYREGVRENADGGRQLFFKPGEYLALRAHGSLFAVPWSYGGGMADRVSVIDHEAASMLRELGVPPEKVLVAGQCSHDVLWLLSTQRSMIRARLDTEFGFDPTRPLLILALPVLGEHGMSSAEKQMEEASWLFQTMKGVAGKNVLVSLHPRQNRSHYEKLASAQGVKIASGPLRNILTAADLFVAYSSTISWAQLLGIPCVAIEYYELGYALFANQPGVAVASSREALGDMCAGALENGEFRSSLVTQLKATAENVPFDGRVRERLIAEIHSPSQRGSSCVSLV
jgi:hypothetical protein